MNPLACPLLRLDSINFTPMTTKLILSGVYRGSFRTGGGAKPIKSQPIPYRISLRQNKI